MKPNDCVTARLDRPENLNDLRDDRLQQRPSVGWQLDNSYQPPGKILLVSQVFVCNDKDIKPHLGQTQQFSVGEAPPPAALNSFDLVPSKVASQRVRHILIEENPHAASSSIRRKVSASSRSTEGKNSKNCSSEKPSDR